MKSFHEYRNVRTAVAAIPGAMMGITTRHSASRRPQPSTWAASSSSTGTRSTNPRRSHTESGRVREMWVTIRPSRRVEQPQAGVDHVERE